MLQPFYTYHSPAPITDASKPVWVNANAIIQKWLANINELQKANIILRCDELPVLNIHPDRLENLMKRIWTAIALYALHAKIYLPIYSEEEPGHSSTVNKASNYTIQFHRNVFLAWDNKRHSTAKALLQARADLLHRQSNLTINQFKSSGSVIRFSLPGKPQ